MSSDPLQIHPIGRIRSTLRDRKNAPRQGFYGGVEAWVEVQPEYADGLLGLAVGDELVLITWLHESRRETLRVIPKYKEGLPLSGVFATRSPDRPNPIGLHPVKLLEIDGNRLRVGPLEAIDGTPVVDIKPVLHVPGDS